MANYLANQQTAKIVLQIFLTEWGETYILRNRFYLALQEVFEVVT